MNVMNVDRLAEFWANLILDGNGWIDVCAYMRACTHIHIFIYSASQLRANEIFVSLRWGVCCVVQTDLKTEKLGLQA